MFFCALKYIFLFNSFYIISNKKVSQGCMFSFLTFIFFQLAFLISPRSLLESWRPKASPLSHEIYHPRLKGKNGVRTTNFLTL